MVTFKLEIKLYSWLTRKVVLPFQHSIQNEILEINKIQQLTTLISIQKPKEKPNEQIPPWSKGQFSRARN